MCLLFEECFDYLSDYVCMEKHKNCRFGSGPLVKRKKQTFQSLALFQCENVCMFYVDVMCNFSIVFKLCAKFELVKSPDVTLSG